MGKAPVVRSGVDHRGITLRLFESGAVRVAYTAKIMRRFRSDGNTMNSNTLKGSEVR